VIFSVLLHNIGLEQFAGVSPVIAVVASFPVLQT